MSSRRAFKFRSFTEQISSIKIDVVHCVNSNNDQPSETNCYFQEALAKWRELNCTIPFNEFVTAISQKANALVQVIHHKDEILESLKEHLKKKDPLVLEPLLDLLVQLARDLQADFYPHFLDFFPILVSICNAKDVSIIEKSFNCFAYLFKFLWRQMLGDITNIYKVYSELFLETQKNHVRRFAVESFGFLLRKVRNLDGLCELMLTSVLRNPEMADGVGILLFEVCRGVPRQFHSCIEKVLPALLYKFCDSADLYNSEDVFQTLSKMIERMAEHTNIDFSSPLWTPLLDTCDSLVLRDKESVSCLKCLLCLIGILVSWRKGSRATTTVLRRTCEVLLKIVPSSSFHLISDTYLHLVSSILLLDHTHSDCQSLLTNIVNDIFKHFECPTETFQFSYELFTNDYQDYFEVILPLTLGYCEQLCSTVTNGKGSEMFSEGSNVDGVLTFLAKLCTQDVSIILQLSHANQRLVKVLEEILEHTIDNNTLWSNGSDSILLWERVWAALKCLQHIRPCSQASTSFCCSQASASFCCHLFNDFYSRLQLKDDHLLSDHFELKSLILAQCINALVNILDRNQLLNIISVKTLLTVTQCTCYSNSLVFLEAILTCVEAYCSYGDVLTVDHFSDFLSVLKTNLSSPSDKMRLVTLRILNSFPHPFLLPDSENPSTSDKCNIIETCLKAEETPPTLIAYRNRIIWLSNLKYSLHKFNRLPDIFKEVPLRFLLGMLYVNFSVLWEPVCELISSYAVSELKSMFWDIFGEALAAVTQATPTESTSPPLLSTFSSCTSLNDVVQDLINNLRVLQRGHPDHVTYRVLLWRSMSQFVSLAESKSKVIVPILYNFIENEYGLTDETFQSTQDICSDDSTIPQQDKPAEEDSMSTCGEEVMESNKYDGGGRTEEKQLKKRRLKHGQLNKTLLVMLTLMSKLTNPKALYRQDDLKQLYTRLLMNRNSEIQGLALNCLLTYKQPFLIPYRENLEQLLDESAFQEQLLCLSSGSEVCVVKEMHKESLVPILIRILYGRRRSSASRSSHSHASRRNVISRFLSSNGQAEITEFLTLLMSPFTNSTRLNSSLVDPKAVIPLKIQLSFLFEISQLLKVIGEQIEPHVPSILTITFSLSRHCAQLLSDYRNQVSTSFLSSLKSIRQNTINLTTEILDLLPHLDLTSIKDSLLSSLVWPQLPKLSLECTQHPTPLLKLLLVCSMHTHLHHLLGSHFQPPDTPLDSIASSSSCTPVFHYVLLCLKSTKASKIVTNTVLEMVLNLLSKTIDDNCHSDDHLGDDDGCHSDDLVLTSQCDTEGLKILRPYLTLLLEHISESVRMKQSKSAISNNDGLGLEFEVLSRITSIANNESHSDQLIELLLPYLLRTSTQNGRWKDAEKILLTIYNLIPAATEPSSCYRTLSKLFQTLQQRNSRDLLCDVYSRLAEKDVSLAETLCIIKKVNSWDARQLDEPDYILRQEGFTEAKQLLKPNDGHLQIKLILPILHNSLFSILESDDISIRDVAASFVSFLIENVSMEVPDAFETLVLATIVPSIIKGVRSKKETTLYECVDLLAQLVRGYSTHSKFSDMIVLANNDPEVDFFKNVRHIQLHRRTRAFRFLSQICSKEELSQYSMTSFLLPLASNVVFSPVMDREHNLVLEAVNVIGGISRKLKWTNYCFLLKHYLRQLPKQTAAHKNIIRVTAAILDNFHFAVSEPEPNDMLPPDSATLEKKGNKDTIDEQEAIEVEEIEKTKEDVKGRLLAERIHNTIMKRILPNLESSLTTSCEVPAHKLSKREDVAVSEKVTVPIAMATTKLLLHLPISSLHLKLPGIILKVCNTLKSRLNDVREAARDTLLKMAQSLGPKFIHYIITEMIATLTRGYQLHVLAFGLYHLLHGIISKLNPGDLDTSLQNLIPVLIKDIFGSPAEEREVKDIVSKTPEAKTCKSILTFGLVARFLSPSLIPNLLRPVKEMLESRTTSKVAVTIEDIFKKVAIGIQRNKAFSPKLLLLFVHEVLTDTVKDVKPKTRKTISEASSLRPVDSRLLPSIPTRSNPPSLAKQNTVSVHLVTQFGLQLFKMALKKGKFKESSPKEHLEMLDPFIPILSDDVMANSRHNKLLSKALNCLMILLPLPLPSLKTCLSDITAHLFTILKHFSYSGSVVSSISQDLVAMAFKSMTVILRDFTHSSVSDDELRLLVSYIEQDIHDYKRQSTAFPLLRVILGRRFTVEEMNDLMYKTAELLVRGDTSRVRTNSRNALVQYILNYPLGKKINRFLDFFVANLSYEEQSGRESVIETLGLVFNKFPQKILVENATYFLVPISSQLINEESSLCRQMLAEMLKILCKRVTKEKRTEITTIFRDWLSQDNIVHKRLAVQLVGFLVDVEEKEFEKRLVIFVPLLLKCLENEHHDSEEVDIIGDEEHVTPSSVSLTDHLVFNALVALEKIFTVCGINGKGQLNKLYDQIWDQVQRYLLYPHSWVRLVSCRLMGLLFGSSDIEEITMALSPSNNNTCNDTTKKKKVWLRFFVDGGGLFRIRQVKQCLMGQLKAQLINEELANQAIKNQVFIAKLLLKLDLQYSRESSKDNETDLLAAVKSQEETDISKSSDEESDDEGNREDILMNDNSNEMSPGQELRHLIYQMDRLTRYEAGHHPKESLKRSCVFKWIAAVAMAMGKEHVSDWLYRLIPPLYKELSNPKKVGGEALYDLAVEVVELIKGVSGKEEFSNAYSQVLSTAQKKKLKRKAQYALEAVVDPEKSIKRRWRKSRQKRESKKRAIIEGHDTTVSASKRLKLMMKQKKKRKL